MSIDTLPFDLADVYERATRTCAPDEIRGVRRAFRRALRAASEGDPKPAILLSYRWP